MQLDMVKCMQDPSALEDQSRKLLEATTAVIEESRGREQLYLASQESMIQFKQDLKSAALEVCDTLYVRFEEQWQERQVQQRTHRAEHHLSSLGATDEPVHSIQAAERSTVVSNSLAANKAPQADKDSLSMRAELWAASDELKLQAARVPQQWQMVAPNVRTVCCGAEHTVRSLI